MGWAWADHDKDAGDGGKPGHEHDARGYDSGGATNGTNQIGELCAVLQALRAHPGPEHLIIESDSQYAINCSTKWLKGWKKNGWRNSQKKPVKNAEVIKAIDAEITKRPGKVDFKWVKGHAGNAGNELVDELARTYAHDCRRGACDGYLPLEGWQSLLSSPYAKGTDVPPDAQLMLDAAGSAPGRRPLETTLVDAARETGEIADEPLPDRGGAKGLPHAPADTPEHAVAATTTDTTPDASDTASENSGRSATRTDAHQPAPVPNGPAPSGLKVTGAVRFSPAPKTSPYYTGGTMHVHGYIAVDGYVDGDGNLTITDADFLR
ncbi:ribonuclease H family protein [Bifidobacterium santillanense]